MPTMCVQVSALSAMGGGGDGRYGQCALVPADIPMGIPWFPQLPPGALRQRMGAMRDTWGSRDASDASVHA